MLNSNIPAILESAVTAIGGVDAAIDACDRMYSADFRSESMLLKEVQDFEDEVYGLQQALTEALYTKLTGNKPPVKTWGPWEGVPEYVSDSFYYECDAFLEAAKDYISKEGISVTVTGDTEVVELCNYKGEGEGLALLALTKNLPVFRSKNESFYQANNM